MMLFVKGKDFRPGDQIMTAKSEPGALMLEHVKCDTKTLPQECWYFMMTGAGEMSLPYYSDQLYKVWRKDVGKHKGNDANERDTYDPKHAGSGDAQERAERLRELPTYQPDTAASQVTALPAQWAYDGRDDDLNHE